MKCSHASDIIQEIKETIAELKSYEVDEKTQSYFAKFLVAYISGCYEEIIESILNEWSCKFHSPEISSYISATLDLQFRNHKTEKIVETLGRFNNSWGKEISNLPAVNKEGLDALVDWKNSLVHQGNITVTLRQVEDFFTRSIKIMEKIDEIVLSEYSINPESNDS